MARTVCGALLALLLGAALAAPAGAQVISYNQADTEDLLGSAGYLDMTGQEFIDAAVEVHWFLLLISGKDVPGGGCDIEFGAEPSGYWEFSVPTGEATTGVAARYCVSEAAATTASAALLHFLARVDASAKGVAVPPGRAPCLAVGELTESVSANGASEFRQDFAGRCSSIAMARVLFGNCAEVSPSSQGVSVGGEAGAETVTFSWQCASPSPSPMTETTRGSTDWCAGVASDDYVADCIATCEVAADVLGCVETYAMVKCNQLQIPFAECPVFRDLVP